VAIRPFRSSTRLPCESPPQVAAGLLLTWLAPHHSPLLCHRIVLTPIPPLTEQMRSRTATASTVRFSARVACLVSRCARPTRPSLLGSSVSSFPAWGGWGIPTAPVGFPLLTPLLPRGHSQGSIHCARPYPLQRRSNGSPGTFRSCGLREQEGQPGCVRYSFLLRPRVARAQETSRPPYPLPIFASSAK
jgi:hypothetical protein